MPEVVSLSPVNVLRTHCDVVAGTVNLNVPLAQTKDVISVKLSLRAEVKTHVTVTRATAPRPNSLDSGHARRRENMRVRILDLEQIIWTPNSGPNASGITSFPFSFNLPTGLPPSFHGGSYSTGGSVQYYLHVKATRKSWYQLNVSVDQAFPYLPTDLNSGPPPQLSDWPGPWQIFRANKKMRRGITSQFGLVEAEFYLPDLPAIPLFQPIPIRLRIICTSKPLSIPATGTPQFEFPRNPKTTHINLNLHQVCNIIVRSYHRVHTDDLGLQAGFGASGDQIQTVMQGPRWTMDGSQGNKGCWSEEVTFISTLIFRCAPPFTTPCLSSSLYLALGIDFPGMGNNLKVDIGPLPLTSGIGPQQSADPMGLGMSASLDLPPPYYEIDT